MLSVKTPRSKTLSFASAFLLVHIVHPGSLFEIKTIHEAHEIKIGFVRAGSFDFVDRSSRKREQNMKPN